MLRPLALLAGAAALAGAFAHALRADEGALGGTVQPHAVEVVVRQPDAVTAIRHDADPSGAAGTEVIVRRALHSADTAAPTLIRRVCPDAESRGEEARADVAAPAMRS